MNKLFTIFHVPELRRKILITVLFLAIYRIGYFVPLPVVDQVAPSTRCSAWCRSSRAAT